MVVQTSKRTVLRQVPPSFICHYNPARISHTDRGDCFLKTISTMIRARAIHSCPEIAVARKRQCARPD